jgi:23S rRNA (cytosine1962-C5)-methyltransferase
MSLVAEGKAVLLQLRKDLVRDIKRGHAWLYSDAIDRLPKAPAGSVAILNDRKGERVASGIYDPQHAIPFRVCRTAAPFTIDDSWLATRLSEAYQTRATYFRTGSAEETAERTTGYRLTFGEGDHVPGLVIDIYDKTAVMKLDGGAPERFYKPPGIATWLASNLPIERVVLRTRERGRSGEVLVGPEVDGPVEFLENGMRFTADVIEGQKTGFFLDQRDNRAIVRRLSAGKRVLNLFSFNGGFSIAAGLGGAQEVTSVDIAAQAIEASRIHWSMNGLNASQHVGVTEDVFDYLEKAHQRKEQWDLVICDPPSFAPSESAKPTAIAAYAKLAALAAKVTATGGLLALASCSSHVGRDDFSECNSEALGRARRKATLLSDCGLPLDHPTPLAMAELRYLKFMLFKLD